MFAPLVFVLEIPAGAVGVSTQPNDVAALVGLGWYPPADWCLNDSAFSGDLQSFFFLYIQVLTTSRFANYAIFEAIVPDNVWFVKYEFNGVLC
jgi:hypothetical protein